MKRPTEGASSSQILTDPFIPCSKLLLCALRERDKKHSLAFKLPSHCSLFSLSIYISQTNSLEYHHNILKNIYLKIKNKMFSFFFPSPLQKFLILTTILVSLLIATTSNVDEINDATDIHSSSFESVHPGYLFSSFFFYVSTTYSS